jgi:hypothetical protein
MPTNPSLGDVHFPAPLQTVSIDYAPPDMPLQTAVFPTIPVVKDSDKIIVYDRADMKRDVAKSRGIGDEAARAGLVMGTPVTYSAEEYAIKVPAHDRIRDNCDPPISYDMRCTRKSTRLVMLQREIKIATLLTTASNWSPTGGNVAVAAGSEWDSETGGDPIYDISLLQDRIYGSIDEEVNMMVIGREVFRTLQRHPLIVGLIKTTSADKPAMATLLALKDYFQIPNIVISRGMYISSAPGLTDVPARIIGDTIWMGKVTDSPALDEMSAGYVVEVTNLTPAKTYRQEERNITWHEASRRYDIKITCAAAGGVITGALSAI